MKAKSLGFYGEKLAAKFLTDNGYEILHNNFSVSGGEIDLVVRKNKIIIFVEVKTRTSDLFGRGEESFNKTKLARMNKAIKRYLSEGKYPENIDYRIDLIEIELEKNNFSLKNLSHFEDIEIGWKHINQPGSRG
ncbi:MAG: YraN family protein [Candidatus Gracilibacteria bacterium]